MKKIYYRLASNVNYGTVDAPDTKLVISPELDVECPETVFKKIEAIIKEQAYKGEYTVEEIPDPPKEPDAWDEMAEAYQRGVQRA